MPLGRDTSACIRVESSCCNTGRSGRLRKVATLLPLALCSAQQTSAQRPWKATITEPIPFSGPHAVDHLDERSHHGRSAEAKLREMRFAEVEARLAAEEENLTIALANQRLWAKDLEQKRQGLQCEKEAWLQSWAEQETAFLHLTVFRLVRIQAAAHGMFRPEGKTLANAMMGDVEGHKHERWSRVAVVTCIPGKMNNVAGDFPVHMLLRASTPLNIINICEESESLSILDISATLGALLVFLNHALATMMGPAPVLIYIVLGTQIFFNEFLEAKGPDGEEVARRLMRHIIDRYEAVVADAAHHTQNRPVVVASEYLCDFCTTEETSLPFLQPGGLAGSAESLATVVAHILHMIQDGVDNPARGLRQLMLRPEVASWIVPDHKQRLFASFVEAVPGPCSESSQTQTSVCTNHAFAAASADNSNDDRHTCCPVASEFDLLHKAYYPRYSVQGCVLKRFGEMPISFHGDGLGKWLYLLALNDLASHCQPVARLVLHNHPVDMLDHVFSLFYATQMPGAAQPTVQASTR